MTSLLRNGIPRTEDGKIDFRPRKHHAWYVVIAILGFLLPPLAVATRFGIGRDFFINIVLTLCGYIPGHGHNFFIQNIRDNSNKARTPKWAKRYGMVNDQEEKRLARKRQWVGRYNDRNPGRVLYDEDGNPTSYDQYHRYDDDGNSSIASGKATPTSSSSRRPNDGTAPGDPRRRGGATALVAPDRYYNEDRRGNRDYGDDAGATFEGDAYALRRSASGASLRRARHGGAAAGFGSEGGGGGRGGFVDDTLPGAGEAARRKAKGGKALGLLGGGGAKGRGKADRHARADAALGYQGGGAGVQGRVEPQATGLYGERDDDLLGLGNASGGYDDLGARRPKGGGRGGPRADVTPSSRHSDIYDADDGPEDADANFGKSYVREQRENQRRAAAAPPPASLEVGMGGAGDGRSHAVDIMDQKHTF